MASIPSNVPQHLRHWVVAQEYERYTPVDHAVWRFVLLQLARQLQARAHPVALNGLRDLGLLADRIPRMEDLCQRLQHLGWSAVCVNGFIRPRAFAQLQAHGVLAIAADIRSHLHVEYTPAPDIIHEAAGHAPLLVEPDYAAYLQRFGEISAKSFGHHTERQLDRAIADLSAVRERSSATHEEIAAAEHALERAAAAVTSVSETARLARLYWWTAEYGLVGSPSDFHLYGAGLLSSLGESRSCYEAAVQKRWLDPNCLDVPYDITKPQPQLFVTPDFPHLMTVLSDVSAQLAHVVGGATALAAAVASGEPATVVLDSELQVVGTLLGFHLEEAGGWLTFAPGVQVLTGKHRPPAPLTLEVTLPLGLPAVSSSALKGVPSAESWQRLPRYSALELIYAHGFRVAGTFLSARVHHGELVAVTLKDAVIHGNGASTHIAGQLCLPIARAVRTAHGGGDVAQSAESNAGEMTLAQPRSARPSAETLRLNALYESARTAFFQAPSAVTAKLYHHVHEDLARSFPEDWLLRWNLLESLKKLNVAQGLQQRLLTELESLEVHFQGQKPILSALQYLDRYPPPPQRHHSVPPLPL